MQKTLLLLVLTATFLSCTKSSDKSYKSLLSSLQNKTEIIELSRGNSRLIVSPFHQGKILASTNKGIEANYIGWINTDALEDLSAGRKSIGGEERVWLSPLGGQHSFYYQQIKPLSDDNWLVPDSMANVAYNVKSHNTASVHLSKTMQLTNFIGTTFNFKIDRTVALLDRNTIAKNLNTPLNTSTDIIGFETSHTLTNLDTIPWKKETGLVGLWSAGMYQGADDAIVVIPVKNNAKLTDIYTYFDPLNHSRLQLKDNVILFKGDAKYWSKIGVPPEYAPTIFGAYIPSKNRLTIVQYKKEEDPFYSNSFIDILDEPYKGEAIPIYNHWEGFFELESNAPLKPLQPNETTSHWHRVYHFSDDKTELQKLAQQILGVDLKRCTF